MFGMFVNEIRMEKETTML